MSINRSVEHLKSFFLTTFLIPRRAKDLPIMAADEWERLLGNDPLVITKQLETDGFVKRSSLAQHIDRKFTLEELKHLASQKELSISGRKEEVILRLVTDDSEKMWELASDENVFECSEKGLGLATQYIQGISRNKTTLLQKLKITKEQLLIWLKWIFAAAAAGVLGNRTDDALMKLSEYIKQTHLSTNVPAATATPTLYDNMPPAASQQRIEKKYSRIEVNGVQFCFIDLRLVGNAVNFGHLVEYDGIIISLAIGDTNSRKVNFLNFFAQPTPLKISNQLIFDTPLNSFNNTGNLEGLYPIRVRIMIDPIPEILLKTGWKTSAQLYWNNNRRAFFTYSLLLTEYFSNSTTKEEKALFFNTLKKLPIPIYSIETML
jgi:hypothetical protein